MFLSDECLAKAQHPPWQQHTVKPCFFPSPLGRYAEDSGVQKLAGLIGKA